MTLYKICKNRNLYIIAIYSYSNNFYYFNNFYY